MRILNNQIKKKRYRKHLKLFVAVLAFLGLVSMTACGTNFAENYYFKSIDVETGETANYYRFRVKGETWFVNSRYISGYFDEQAVNAFFNEMKIDRDNRRIDQAQPEQPQTPAGGENNKTVMAPIDSSQNGVFVMIMSTDASSIAETIGAFAESQVTAQAITNLINRGEIEKQSAINAETNTRIQNITALQQEIEKLEKELPEGTSPNKEETKETCLQIIRAISRALKGPDSIKNFDTAQGWVSTIKD